MADSGQNKQSLSHCPGVIQRPTTIMMRIYGQPNQWWEVMFSHMINLVCMLLPTLLIVVASPSSTLSDKSFHISGDHPVGLICGNHMMVYTVAWQFQRFFTVVPKCQKKLS
nr:hypothetical protein [Tanacetum cinerariifolium]